MNMDSDEGSPPSPPGPPSEPPPSLPPPLPARPRKALAQPPVSMQTENNFDENEVDADDDNSQQMTASYSEISFKSGASPENEDVSLSLTMDPIPLADQILQRPITLLCERKVPAPMPLRPLNLEGTVHVEGNMTHFVTEDLEYKIKLSSPVSKKGDTPPLPGCSKTGTPNNLYRQLLVPQVSQVDTGLLNDLEAEAQHMATSIDNLTENLCGILNSISSITADNVDVYKDAVSKMSDAMDANIKSIYTMMAKAEEVTQSMKSVQVHAARIKEIKRLVDLFESYI